MVRIRGAAVTLALGLLLGCKPDFDDRAALVEGPRVLAVASTPAEAPPGARVSLRALFVDAGGTPADAPIDWALCRERKPLTELGPVNPACFAAASPELVSLGVGLHVTVTIFPDACRLFGPNPPESKKGEPRGRPVDPDLTGGFYVPTRLRWLEGPAESYATGQTRLTCDPGRVTPEQAREYQHLYRANENPAVERLVAVRGPSEETLAPVTSSEPTLRVARGEAVTLRVSWPACPASAICGDGICSPDEDATNCEADCRDPHGCTGSESYVAFDPLTLALGERRELIRASWFATAGTFDVAATGSAERGAAPDSSNVWHAPNAAGKVYVWIVLRDDRQGAGWESYEIDVE
ncbi:MAG TPA: hypothetical protein VJT73_12955 [Polyangiaceae bacterium]|nr:hypothetical protein [Polyangiaceae bacterium]